MKELVRQAHIEHPYGYWGYVAAVVNKWLHELSISSVKKKVPSIERCLWIEMSKFFFNIRLSMAKGGMRTMEHELARAAAVEMLGKDSALNERSIEKILLETSALFESLKPGVKYGKQELLQYNLLAFFLDELYYVDEIMSPFSEGVGLKARILPEEHYYVLH